MTPISNQFRREHEHYGPSAPAAANAYEREAKANEEAKRMYEQANCAQAAPPSTPIGAQIQNLQERRDLLAHAISELEVRLGLVTLPQPENGGDVCAPPQPTRSPLHEELFWLNAGFTYQIDRVGALLAALEI